MRGNVLIRVAPERESKFTVKLRIPGWVVNQPIPGNLYSYSNSFETKPTIKMNDEAIVYTLKDGYALLTREWGGTDEIEQVLPMEIKKVKANENLEVDKGKLAIERGPIVYCVEENDNPQIDELYISENTQFSSSFSPELLAGIEVIEASGDTEIESFKAIPYYVWKSRGANKMNVWPAVK